MGALDEGTWLDTVRSSKSAWSRGCCRRRVRRWTAVSQTVGISVGTLERWRAEVLARPVR